ncbi:MAG: FkbM family methyltransferase [Prosthecobacter sp.]|uniref:FkbM family methyltransferase n=1 Tax=Prosthecobacter sp. TaxID=1965333 RepID=UPI0025FB79F5|nr:FkbM family methyltransferase [Prosthecobacter sp.]MCF7787343.1 FkbM family methyltransferase [Prosthecobacter sp.]
MNTKTKIGIAKCIYRALRLVGFSQHRIITRNGVRFDADLAEGIDLSLFLFGSFQKWVIDDSLLPRKSDFCAIDIGANIGAICLPLAARNADSRIIAVEPTDHAYQRLQRNLELNPTLQPRIKTVQAFMGDGSQTVPSMIAYPSWRLDNPAGAQHEVHMGQAHEVSCPMLSIDSLVQQEGLNHLDFIKIDTDGHELDILKGGTQTIERWRPIIVFEFCFYENEKRGYSFTDFTAFFHALNYDICLSDKTTRIADDAAARRVVPPLGSYDFAAIPR